MHFSNTLISFNFILIKRIRPMFLVAKWITTVGYRLLAVVDWLMLRTMNFLLKKRSIRFLS